MGSDDWKTWQSSDGLVAEQVRSRGVSEVWWFVYIRRTSPPQWRNREAAAGRGGRPTHVEFNAKCCHSRFTGDKYMGFLAINSLSRRGQKLRPCADETGDQKDGSKVPQSSYSTRVTRRVARLGANRLVGWLVSFTLTRERPSKLL